MPAFRFEAIDQAGKTQKGVLDADSARAARSQLRTQGLTPLVVEPAGSAHARRAPAAAVARAAAVAARTGDSHAPAREPADRGLAARRNARGADRAVGARLHPRTDGRDPRRSARRPFVRQRARRSIRRTFPEIYRALVAAGEHTGKLGLVLSRLADYIEQRNALKQKIMLAFTYPAIVTLIAFGIVTFLLSYVVPQVVNVFASTKQALPFLTVMMMALSGFVRQLLVGGADRRRAVRVDREEHPRAARSAHGVRPVAARPRRSSASSCAATTPCALPARSRS